jgi:RNA polymerase sigma-70 factor (ECF subfamily)
MNSGLVNADESLGKFRGYLRGLAQSHLSWAYSSKVDPSDIVQQTLLDAHQKLDEFRGSTDRELAAWLREIFVNNLADVFRALNSQKRDITRERSSDRLSQWLEDLPAPHDDQSEKNEQLICLAWALSELPQLQHVAIELHHLQGLSLAETAKRLRRTEASVAGLIRRGIARLRGLLTGSSARPDWVRRPE